MFCESILGFLRSESLVQNTTKEMNVYPFSDSRTGINITDIKRPMAMKLCMNNMSMETILS